MERCRDFHVVELNVQPFDRSNVPDMQELLSSRELGFQLSERVALDVGQLDVEMDELRRTRRRLDDPVSLADHIREVRIVACMGTEAQPERNISQLNPLRCN